MPPSGPPACQCTGSFARQDVLINLGCAGHAQGHGDVMCGTIVSEPSRSILDGPPIQLDRAHASRHTRGVAHFYYVLTGTVAILDRELPPVARHARLDSQVLAALREAEQRFHRNAIGPRSRTRIPGPAAASNMVGRGVYVRTHRVGLDLVALDIRVVAGVCEGIEHAEEL